MRAKIYHSNHRDIPPLTIDFVKENEDQSYDFFVNKGTILTYDTELKPLKKEIEISGSGIADLWKETDESPPLNARNGDTIYLKVIHGDKHNHYYSSGENGHVEISSAILEAGSEMPEDDAQNTHYEIAMVGERIAIPTIKSDLTFLQIKPRPSGDWPSLIESFRIHRDGQYDGVVEGGRIYCPLPHDQPPNGTPSLRDSRIDVQKINYSVDSAKRFYLKILRNEDNNYRWLKAYSASIQTIGAAESVPTESNNFEYHMEIGSTNEEGLPVEQKIIGDFTFPCVPYISKGELGLYDCAGSKVGELKWRGGLIVTDDDMPDYLIGQNSLTLGDCGSASSSETIMPPPPESG